MKKSFKSLLTPQENHLDGIIIDTQDENKNLVRSKEHQILKFLGS